MDFADLALNPRKAQKRFSPFVDELPDDYLSRLDHEFRDRATADPAVCAVYSSEPTAVPKPLAEPLKRRAWAVVTPRVRGDLVDAIDFAREHNMPVVPRGGGTGGYGGAVPTEGGLVVDMTGFDRVFEVDEEEGTVTVEPGITWAALADELADHGLAPRQVPHHAQGSTVGGWIARGGAGVGSHRHGGVAEDVVEATLVTPEGELRTFSGDDLDLVVGAWGITGFVVEVTLRVTGEPDLVPHVASYDDGVDAAQAVRRLCRETDAWHVAAFSEGFTDLTNEAADGSPYPTGWVVLAVIDAGDDETEETTRGILKSSGGDLASEDAAEAVWGERHTPRRMKRNGPGLVVGEARVGAEDLAAALEASDLAIKAREYGYHVYATDVDEVQVTYLAPDDDRRAQYAKGWGNALAHRDAIKSVGGRAAHTGVTQAHEAKSVLGKDRLKRLKAYKAETDEEEIFHPGPVLGPRLKGVPWPRLYTTWTRVNTPLIKSVRGQSSYLSGARRDPSYTAVKRAVGSVQGGPLGKLEREVHSSTHDGRANHFAPEAAEAQWETQLPRGRIHLADAILTGEASPTELVHRHASQAPLGHRAQAHETTGVPVERVTDLLLNACVRDLGPLPEHEVLARFARERGNVLGKPDEDRTEWAEVGFPFDEDARNLLYADDVAAYEAQEVVTYATQALTNAGVGLQYLGAREAHAGETLVETGQRAAAREVAADLVEACVERGVGRVVTPSANAVRVIRNDWPAFAEEAEDLDPDHVPSARHAAAVLHDAHEAGRLEFQGGEADEAADGEAEEETAGDGGTPDGAGDGEEPDWVEDYSAAQTKAQELDIRADRSHDDLVEGIREAEDAEAPGGEEAADDAPEQAADEEGEDGDAADEGFEAVTAAVHLPEGLSEDERQAVLDLAEAIPDVTVAGTVDHECGHGRALKQSWPGLHETVAGNCLEAAGADTIVTASPGCHTSLDDAAAAEDVVSLYDLVAERVVERETGGGAADVSFEEEEEEFVEEEIPEGKHRVEFVKEKIAIPVDDDEVILDIAQQYDRLEDLPFSCRAGNCVTCGARYEGEAPDQTEGEALEEEEQETHVLTCIAKPEGDVRLWSGEAP
jgi:FAD/FMN-containing dehydrogenase/Fe-S oxidoreductase